VGVDSLHDLDLVMPPELGVPLVHPFEAFRACNAGMILDTLTVQNGNPGHVSL
jgi:hypothetical protein